MSQDEHLRVFTLLLSLSNPLGRLFDHGIYYVLPRNLSVWFDLPLSFLRTMEPGFPSSETQRSIGSYEYICEK
ncbi:hypothetical protein CEXT_450361 [Caerostris extrusa]|uniref:Uncharacterized protein n=1 Tax=Caerostris extrusa TaxID=172846 RepID=A0AAV4XN46_CAEEX|nr:hypothetical protein CEXT_450361 [Caerostris extrusa]